eukprot:TRINITY_DN1776_c1_g1_i5.p2 TRINITY_DN1776_c1_g1~~TRINITY_DN1776_c1_g1_i5.p2  ORF type:complete len:162 (-),score=49.98 TRINITY_DN1776_c1_g1_i5:135-557(-)
MAEHKATVREFFDACERGDGWEVCKKYCTSDASFSAQCEPLVDVKTVEAYTEWMKGLAHVGAPDCSVEVHHFGVDEEKRSFAVVATFRGTHTGEWGPCPPTGKSCEADYVYQLDLDAEGKVCRMKKVWNAPWSMKQFGWM